KLALEDAIALADVLDTDGASAALLARYEELRRIEVLKLQNAARNSTEWFENVARYAVLPPEQFAYSLLTRSQRIGHENLRLRDKTYVERMEGWFAERSLTEPRTNGEMTPAAPVPPMFTSFRLRDLVLRNRVVVSPMDMYSAVDGMPNDFHLVHLGSRAMGGAAMVVTEMTCVSPDGRITPWCTGLWNDQQGDAFRRIVDFVHSHTTARIALQLGHSGGKGSTRRMWEGIDQPLDTGNWPLISASAVPYIAGVSQIPRAVTIEDMDQITEEFVAASRRGIEAGFDWLELHCAHGYLLSSFISPLTNRREDEFGGSLENRCRFPLRVFRAMRDVWPQERPMSVRISAHDWAAGGITPDDAVAIARLFYDAGADMIDCSSGQVTKAEKPVYGRMFQVPFADKIRNEAGIPTIAVGNIFEGDHVNTIIAAGRADLCAIGRAHLADPYWTLHEAAKQQFDMPWPDPYLSGKSQLERNLARAAAMAIQA
ncbi:MAG: hypothetical protein JOZ43_02465, partial [Acidobacteriales bacterium]|nr:hypothetical protein [Terriglobales bacterium]